MKKKIILVGVATLLLCGCGKIPTLKNGEDAIVTFKDGKGITANDFYKEIKDSYGLEALVGMIDKYVYESEFKDKMAEAEDYAANYVKSLRTNYETDEKLLQALKMAGYNYQTVEAYQNSLYISYLQNEAIETYVKDRITEDELKDYYEKNVYPNMNISHILVTPEVKDGASEDEKKEAEDKAKEKVKNIIKELDEAKKANKDINEEFSRLAKDNSQDDSTKDKGGDLGEINLGSLNARYDELVKSASKLKDGEYSTDVITTEAGYHVILKTKTGEKESYDNSVDSMKEKITTNKLSENQSLMVDAIKHYRDKYELNIVDSEISSQYGKYMNNLINNAKSSSSSN